MRRRNFLLATAGTALAGTALTGAAPAAAAPADTAPQAAQDAVLAAFDKHPIVGGSSPTHGVRNVDEFLISLLCNPRLPDVVTDIVAENGNSLYQPLVDEYIAGGDVPLATVRQAWRSDLLAEGAYSTFYEQLYPLVRRINQRLPHAKRLRVLAAEPPIDWSTVTGFFGHLAGRVGLLILLAARRRAAGSGQGLPGNRRIPLPRSPRLPHAPAPVPAGHPGQRPDRGTRPAGHPGTGSAGRSVVAIRALPTGSRIQRVPRRS